jgi:hypothetical protein
MKDDPLYNPTDCFETFPFPPNWQKNKNLEQIGEEYHQFRAELMVRKDHGLTTTYNRFHDKDEEDLEIKKLRDLHAQMDRVVMDAYGWIDLQPRHAFILEYEEPEEEESGVRSRRKKPWRYRWVDDDRDEVLARLLELNRMRAEEEAQSAAARTAKAVGKRSEKSPKGAPVANHKLFEAQESTE